MPPSDDIELLQEYRKNRSEPAFTTLVERHINLVFAAALRITRDKALAQDVTQQVFLDLAAKAATHANCLEDIRCLPAWLYRHTCFASFKLTRSEQRRRQREEEAHHLKAIMEDDTSGQPVSEELRSEIDSAMLELEESDRTAVISRYLEGNKYIEVGTQLGLSENAARMKVDRALDKLRGGLQRRGIISSTAAVSVFLTQQATITAPSGLAASIVSASVAAGAATGVTATSAFQILMATTKSKIFAAAVLTALLTVPVAIQYQSSRSLREEATFQSQQAGEMTNLRSEVLALKAALQKHTMEREAQQAELRRLRDELASTKAQLDRALRIPVKPGTRAEAEPTTKPADDPLILAANWRNQGLATASATLQTLEWAKARGDTGMMLNCVAWGDEESRQRIEEMYSAAPESVRNQFASVDSFALDLLNRSSARQDGSRITAYRVVEERASSDDMVLHVESHWTDGQKVVNPLRYVRVGNEWRQALEFASTPGRSLGLYFSTKPPTSNHPLASPE